MLYSPRMLADSTTFKVSQGDTDTALEALSHAANINLTLNANVRAVQDRLFDTPSVKDLGLKGNSSGDLGQALQWIHDHQLGANGGIIEIPAAFSNYPIVTPFVANKPVLIRGGAHRACSILCTTANMVCLSFTNWFAIEGLEFTLIGDAAASSIAIKGLASSNGHNGSRIIHTRITGGKIGIHHERANELRIDDVILGSYGQYGVLLENTTNSDEGDNHILNTTFAGGSSSGTVGLYVKDAGLYAMNNKVNGSHSVGVIVEASAGNVGDINWHGGSIEGVTNSSFLTQTGGGYQITKIQILGTQFSSLCANHLNLGGTVNNVIAIGNVYNGDASATTGVVIGPGVQSGILDSSEFHALTKGIELNVGGGGWTIGKTNRFASNVTTVFTGPSGQVPNNPPMTSSIHLSLGKYLETHDATQWVNVFSWTGLGEFKYQLGEIVQGVGTGCVFGSGYFSGNQKGTGEMQQMIPANPLIDAQVIDNGGGGLVLQVKTHTLQSGTADIFAKIELIGMPDKVLQN